MGTTQSTKANVESSLDNRIKQALHELRQAKEKSGTLRKGDPFTKIMLKFPQVAESFNTARETFDVFDEDKKGYIDHRNLKEALQRLGSQMTSSEIDAIFNEADMHQSGQLNFSEFLKIPSLEGVAPGPLSPMSPKSKGSCLFGHGEALKSAFELVLDAFFYFDVNGTGSIERKDMGKRLLGIQVHSPTKKMKNRKESSTRDGIDESLQSSTTNLIGTFVTDQRFKEMDWDHDGNISFKEFLIAFEGWVGVKNDEEDFDDE